MGYAGRSDWTLFDRSRQPPNRMPSIFTSDPKPSAFNSADQAISWLRVTGYLVRVERGQAYVEAPSLLPKAHWQAFRAATDHLQTRYVYRLKIR